MRSLITGGQMKKAISLILSLVLICSAIFTTSARTKDTASQNFDDNKWEYTLEHDNTAKIVGYTSNERVLNIPNKIDGYTVTSIGSTAFCNSDIEKIIFSDSIKTIGWWAFYGCDNLSEVVLNNGLNTIEYGAFMNCKKLSQLEIPSTVAVIGEDALAVTCYTQKNIKDVYSKKTVSRQRYTTDNEFTVYGYSGTLAEKYADDKEFEFYSKGTIVFGDVDLNGEVDNEDIILLEKYTKGETELSETQLLNADVNGDANSDYEDLALIEKYVQNLISYYNYPVTENIADQPVYFEGMSMYCDGDSVAKGTGTNIFGDDFYSYCNYLSEEYNMSFVNNSIAGTTLAKQNGKTKESNRSILERVQKMGGDYDIILLDGGFNDLFQSIKIGEVTDDSDKSGKYDEYTTAGALESICYFLNKNYKDSIKLFVLCHNRNANPDQYKYWNTIKQVLEKWDIDYIDFSTETEFCDVNDEISTQYFMYNDDDKVGDGIHPLKYAAKKIYGPMIAEKLNDLARDRLTAEFEETEVKIGMAEKAFQNFELSRYTDEISVRWASEDTSVAVTDENGNVSPRGTGSTIIRACTSDGITAEYKVTVKLMAMEMSFTEKEIHLNIGESYKLETSMLFDTAAHDKTYTTSDASVVSVDEQGVITANSAGTAVILCKICNGVKAECTVTVSNNNNEMLLST
ncbi:MAG: leucine-rich repeat protein [Ruminococcus sp.]|nr:leucine-rich repeat protein [Ruminococcus sp.]